MPHKPHSYLASPEGLAERFDRPPVHYPYRVLRFRADTVPGEDGGRPVYANVEYEVQFQPEPGKPVTDIRWMPVAEWRELMGFANHG